MKERFLEILEKSSTTINSIESALQIISSREMIFGVLISAIEITLFLLGNYYSNKEDDINRVFGKDCYKLMAFGFIAGAIVMLLK